MQAPVNMNVAKQYRSYTLNTPLIIPTRTFQHTYLKQLSKHST